MRTRTFGYFFQQAFSSIRRNGWMSVASIITMAISLMVVGTSLLIVLNTNQVVATIESDVEIMVYVDTQVSPERTLELGVQLQSIPGLTAVEFISKEQALEGLKGQFAPENDPTVALSGMNPLNDAYRLKVEEPRNVAAVAQELTSWPEFEKVRYGQGVVEKMFSVTSWIKVISLVLMLFLTITAVFVIATTIRLAMNARRKEIGIMKIVGATNWFVRWPFLIEGLVLGVIGAIIAVGILSGTYLFLVNNLQESISFIPLIRAPETLVLIFGGLLATGLGLGILGTVFSIYKFLDV